MTVARKLTRRNFTALAATGLTAAFTTPFARAGQGIPKPPAGPSGESRLLIAQPQDDFGLVTDLLTFDARLEQLATIAIEDMSLMLYTTPDPSVAVISGLSAPSILDLGDQAIRPIETDASSPSMIFPPNPTIDGPTGFGDRCFVAPSFAMDQILLVDIDSAEGQDITRLVVPASQEIAPAMANFGRGGRLMGLWTGNWVWFVDADNPEDAYPLHAGNEDLYSTNFDISNDEQWLTYTTYEPGGSNGQVVLQRVDDPEPIVLAEGTAWSSAEFVAGLPDAFLLANKGTLEIRSLDDPTAPGEELGTFGSQLTYLRAATSNGLRQALGTRETDNGPMSWHLLDLESGTLDHLGDLDACSPLLLTTWRQDQRYALFGPEDGIGESGVEGDLIGLDLQTGESFTMLEDTLPPDTHSTSIDGRWAAVANTAPDEVHSAWVLDLADRAISELPSGKSGHHVQAVSLHPDGAQGAISYALPGGVESEVFAFDTVTPDDTTLVDRGELLGWS